MPFYRADNIYATAGLIHNMIMRLDFRLGVQGITNIYEKDLIESPVREHKREIRFPYL